MTWLTAILGALRALPEIINLAKQFMTWVEKVTGNDAAGFIKKVSSAMTDLNNAKTPEDRTNAAKSIAELISGL